MSSLFVQSLGLLAVATSAHALAAPAADAPPLAVATPPASPAERSLPPATPERRALAREVVGLTTELALLQEAVSVGWELGIKQEAANFAKMDAAIPGLSKSIADRGKAEVTEMVVDRLPALQAELAQLLSANATDDELRAMADFYRTPTGRKIIRAMMLSPAGMDAGDDAEFTSGELSKAARSAATDAIGKLSGDEMVELMKFSVSPGGRAARQLAPKRDALLAGWMTALMKDFEARIEPMIAELVEQALAQKAK